MVHSDVDRGRHGCECVEDAGEEVAEIISDSTPETETYDFP